MVKLGLKLGPEEYPPVDLLEYAVIAEDAGYEAIDVSDHFHPWAEVGQRLFHLDLAGRGGFADEPHHARAGGDLPDPALSSGSHRPGGSDGG